MSWHDELPLLRCIDCPGELKTESESALVCRSCARRYPIRGEILKTGGPDEGSNRITADFYDSERWSRFRFWERLFWLVVGGENKGRREVMRYFPELSRTRVLEVGIGDGANVEFFPESCALYGNDISLVQLDACHQRHKHRDLRLFLGQAETLPFKDRVFDHLLSVGGFNYFSDPSSSLREMARVVKSGGLIVVADETPRLGKYLLKFRRGRKFLERLLGSEFAALVERHIDMQLEPIVGDVLKDAEILRIWRGLGYCIVGRAPDS